MAKNIRERAIKRQENNDKRPRAVARHIRMSPYKVRIVLDLIRGKAVDEAVAILENTQKSASEPIRKAVLSAAANAEHNKGMNKADLYIAACFADQGPTLKRMRPRAQGRAFRILKRTSHITVVLDATSK